MYEEDVLQRDLRGIGPQEEGGGGRCCQGWPEEGRDKEEET